MSATSPKNKDVWSYLMPYLVGLKGTFLLAIGINALHGFAVTFQNLVPKYLFDDVLLAEGLEMEERYRRLGLLVLLYLFASVVGRMLTWHLSYRIFTRVREKVLLAMRSRFFGTSIHSVCAFTIVTTAGSFTVISSARLWRRFSNISISFR
ncbi:MAG: hypothetical protein HC904_11895 [Blastochloris sp.]|nr:hypothetical protein [Blastochloris sp.]